MNAARDFVLTGHPSRRLRSLSSVYNCMGMVFASRRTWIEPEQLPIILEGDEYKRVPNESEIVVGDVVVYKDGTGSVSHIGTVTEVRINLHLATREIMVLSQWGRDGEYFHPVDDVSGRLGTASEYWTDRA